jgi:hypothetical protein
MKPESKQNEDLQSKLSVGSRFAKKKQLDSESSYEQIEPKATSSSKPNFGKMKQPESETSDESEHEEETRKPPKKSKTKVEPKPQEISNTKTGDRNNLGKINQPEPETSSKESEPGEKIPKPLKRAICKAEPKHQGASKKTARNLRKKKQPETKTSDEESDKVTAEFPLRRRGKNPQSLNSSKSSQSHNTLRTRRPKP